MCLTSEVNQLDALINYLWYRMESQQLTEMSLLSQLTAVALSLTRVIAATRWSEQQILEFRFKHFI